MSYQKSKLSRYRKYRMSGDEPEEVQGLDEPEEEITYILKTNNDKTFEFTKEQIDRSGMLSAVISGGENIIPTLHSTEEIELLLEYMNAIDPNSYNMSEGLITSISQDASNFLNSLTIEKIRTLSELLLYYMIDDKKALHFLMFYGKSKIVEGGGLSTVLLAHFKENSHLTYDDAISSISSSSS